MAACNDMNCANADFDGFGDLCEACLAEEASYEPTDYDYGWGDSGQYDDDPSPYSGTYSEM